MGRIRYKTYEPTHPHFVTCTILNWISIFTREESTDIIFESIKYLQQEGFQPKLVRNENMMIETVNYIHQNPVKRGYVDDAVH